MEALLDLPSVFTSHEPNQLRKLVNAGDTHVTSLCTLGVNRAAYGALLNSILIPTEIRVIISREFVGKS